MDRLLEVDRLLKTFTLRRGARFPWEPVRQVHALRGVSLRVDSGETVGLVGESGSGKTTLARCIVLLETPSGGVVRFEGKETGAPSNAALRAFRTRVQMVFQDSYASMNPRMTIAAAIEEPLRLLTSASPRQRAEQVGQMARDVGLTPELLNRYRHQVSGGQLQRANVARALVVHPALVVLDEPVSSLDASVRGHVLNLLASLRAKLGCSYLMISHDLHTVRSVCDRVVIMYRGRVVEAGSTSQIFGSPGHPYTQLLMASQLSAASLPTDSIQMAALSGQVAQGESDGTPPDGQEFVEVEAGHLVAVHG